MAPDFDGLATIWEHEVQLSLAGPHRGGLALRLAQLLTDELGDAERARTYAQMACEDLGDGAESDTAQSLLSSLGEDAPVESGRAEDLAETLKCQKAVFRVVLVHRLEKVAKMSKKLVQGVWLTYVDVAKGA